MAKIALFKAGNLETASGPKASVSVPNDGRVTFLVIGAGTGRWRAHVAFAEVLNGVVLRRWDAFVTDAEPISALLLDSNNGTLAGWLVEGEGTFAVGGFADAAEGAFTIAMHDMGAFAGAVDLESTPKAYLATGARASVLGGQCAYGAGGWVADGLTPYADYATLSAQAPTVGKIAQIPRLCGNGYFALRGNGARWEVCPGESIVRDAGAGSAGYDLTATGTAYVPLVSYTIPAGLIGDGEEWEFDIHAMSLDVRASGNDYVESYVGSTKFLGSGPTLLSGVSQVARKRGAFVRLGGVLAMRAGTATADLYVTAPNNDAAVDMSIPQVLTAGFGPGAATNKMRLRHFCLRRIG